MTLSKRKKRNLILVVSLALVVILCIACLSPLAKYLLQKYDTTVIIGREITVETAYVNPFTGYVRFGGIKIFEDHSDRVFISAKSLSGNFAMLKLFLNTYQIDNLCLDEPKVYVIQNKEQLNFGDIIDFYTPKKPRAVKKEPLHLNLLDMEITKGEFFYHEQSIPVKYSVKKLNAKSPGLMWEKDSMNIGFDFFSGNDTGEISGNMVFDKNNGDYKLAVLVKKYDLRFIEQYLKDLANFGKFRATLDADFKASGNFKEAQNINTKGLFIINDLHVGKKINEDYASFKKFIVNIEQLNPQNNKYLFDSVSLKEPFFKYELYDYLNNVEMMFGQEGKKAESHSEFNIIVAIGKYIEQLSRNFFKSDYKINRLAIYNGSFIYNDYTLGEKFSVSADPVSIAADSIKRDNKPVHFSFHTGIKPYGDASIDISINPKDSSDFDVDYNFEQIPVTLFNPYLIHLTSYPLDRGTLEFKGKWRVRNGYITSTNHLTIIDPRIYKRVRSGNNKWIPIRFIAYCIRESGNVIDYEIPITGSLKDPKFHFKDVIFDIAKNVFFKPVASPYLVRVRMLENKIEKSRVLRWEMRQNTLSSDQEKFLSNLSDFLLENPGVALEINQSVYSEKEKEYILLYEAKKMYYLTKHKKRDHHLTAEEEKEIENMPIKDSLFIHFLNIKTKQPLLFTVHDKCLALVGKDVVNVKFTQLLEERKAAFTDYFKSSALSGRIKIKPMEDKIPYNGFSSYRIDYKGKLPPELAEAMEDMEKLNNRNPRKKFKKDRDTRRSLIRAKKRKS